MPTKLWRPKKRSHKHKSEQIQKRMFHIVFKIICLADDRRRKRYYRIKTTDNLSQIDYHKCL